MKKLKILIFLLVCMGLSISPLVFASAQSSIQTFYPSGISDYVDLNNITHFAVSENKIYYCKSDNIAMCYNKDTKQLTQLTDSNDGEILNIEVEGNYVFISTRNKIVTFDKNTDNETAFNYQPNAYSTIDVHYVNNLYYFTYVKQYISSYSLELSAYSDLREECIQHFVYTTGVNSSFANSKISMSNNLIIVKPSGNNYLYLFNYPTTISDVFSPIPSSNNDNYHIVADSSNMKTMECITNNQLNVILMGMNNGSTQVCEFNGSSLDSNSNNERCDLFDTDNNVLNVYNSNNANICTYSYNPENNKFTNEFTILAGKGSEIGRFKDVTNITSKGNVMYITDSGNKRIQIMSEDFINTPISYTGSYCSDVVVDTNNNIYYSIYSGTNSIIYKNSSRLYTINNTKIISMSINLNNTLVMLSSEGNIYEYTSSTPTLIQLNFDVNENSRIRVNYDISKSGNELKPISSIATTATYAVSVDDKIYSINRNNGNIAKTLTFSGNVLDFKFNFYNQVLVLQDNGNFTNACFTDAKVVTLEGFDDYTCFSIDIVSGQLQMYNANMSAIELYSNSEFSPVNDFHHYYNIKLDASYPIGINRVWDYTELKSNSLIYDYYYYQGAYRKVNVNTPVFVLQGNEEFVFIGYTIDNQFHFGYVQPSNLSKSINSMAIDTEPTIKLRTTNKNVSVFKYPTIYNNTVISTYDQGYIISSYGKYTTSIDGNEYYVVKIGDNYGYVCSKDVILNQEISRSIRTNATIKIYDNSNKASVYLTNEDGAKVICQLEAGHKINVIDYNKNSKYSKITFIDSDQQEREGYVLTSYVKLTGLTTTIITAIVLLVLDIIIAVIVIAFFHNYKKKQREKTRNM